MLTIERMKAHLIEKASIENALASLAREKAERQEPGSLSPFSGEGKSNDYWTFKGWSLFEKAIYVDFEFISQSPDCKTISLDVDCFPLKSFR